MIQSMKSAPLLVTILLTTSKVKNREALTVEEDRVQVGRR